VSSYVGRCLHKIYYYYYYGCIVIMLYPLAQIRNLEHHHVCARCHQTLASFVYYIIYDGDDDDVWTWNDGDRYIFSGRKKNNHQIAFHFIIYSSESDVYDYPTVPVFWLEKQYCCVHYTTTVHTHFTTYLICMECLQRARYDGGVYNATSLGSSWLLLLLLLWG